MAMLQGINDISQIDISTAFIYGRLPDYIYIALPLGHDKRRSDKQLVWRTKASIYGLEQSPSMWNKRLDEVLQKFNLTSLRTEPCIYTLRDNDHIILTVLIYVDDILFYGKASAKEDFSKFMNQQFKIKSKSNVENFIGVQINKVKQGLILHQTKHISQNLKRFNLDQILTQYSTPLEMSENILSSNNKVNLLDSKEINYLVQCSRPDGAYSACVLAQKAKCPTKNDLKRALRVLIYFKSNSMYGIEYNLCKTSDIYLEVYVDSSFANGSNRKSINGYIIFINKNLLHWKSRTSAMVCQSSTEAEFVAVAMAMKDVEWIFNMLLELKQRIVVACVYCDNEAAIKIFKSHVSTARTKHMDYRLQYVKELFSNRYELRYVRTEDNIADMFTKSLGKNNFYKMLNKVMKKFNVN